MNEAIIENCVVRSEVGSGRKGLVLIAVLWVVVVLGVIVAMVGRTTRLDTKICLTRDDELRCKWAGRAGVDTAIAVLNEDSKRSDSLSDLWSRNEADFNDVELGQCIFNVGVIDEAGKLNVNTATEKQLLELPDMTKEIAEAILDWRDKNDSPRSGGAEGGYYENLPYGYKIRNGRFRTIRELLKVRGVTAELLYGEDTNLNGQLDYNERDGDKTEPADDGDDELDRGWMAYLTCYSVERNIDAEGSKRININEDDEDKLAKSLKIEKSHAKWIVENRKKKEYKSIADLISNKSPKEAKGDSKEDPDRAQELDLETFSKIADKITISGKKSMEGKININTAPKIVLAALLGGGDRAEKLAENIITHREGLIGGMESIADVLKAPSMKIDTFKRIANHITTRSDVYTIRCFATAQRGEAAGMTLETETVVDRSKTPCRILYSYQGAGN